MKLKDELINYLKQIDFTEEGIEVKSEDDYDSVSYYMEYENGVVLEQTYVFYDDQMVDFIISREIEDISEIAVLKQLNSLNFEYSGMTFFYLKEADKVFMKTKIDSENDGKKVLQLMMSYGNIVSELFAVFNKENFRETICIDLTEKTIDTVAEKISKKLINK